MLKVFRKPLVIGKIYSVADLNTSRNALSSINNKLRVPILVIDDEGFAYKERLRDDGYNITCLTQIEDLDATAKYPIIICDIKGVGTSFSEKEGAYVVSELKKRYPFKQVAVYSGMNYSLDLMDDLEGIIKIKKDSDIDEWRSYLDELIRLVTDPKENWNVIRNFLLEKQVPLKDIMLLESNYVDIYNNRPDEMVNFPEQKVFPSITQDIRGVIQSLIAGGILYLIQAL